MLREWMARGAHTRAVLRCWAPSYGDAIETWFPLACAQDETFNAVTINAANPDVVVVINADDGSHECWRVACVHDWSEADEVRHIAAAAKACADDIDDAEVASMEEWRSASWALAAFEQIAMDLAWEAKCLDREAEEELA